ncbi:hypothetical protein IVB28_09375 [Bradyrhizobium sp. 199]|nr:hypothetical protein [Bradyrhizobium sp. 199]
MTHPGEQIDLQINRFLMKARRCSSSVSARMPSTSKISAAARRISLSAGAKGEQKFLDDGLRLAVMARPRSLEVTKTGRAAQSKHLNSEAAGRDRLGSLALIVSFCWFQL